MTKRCVGLVLFLTTCASLALQAATQSFEIRDHLNREWTGEYVSYEVTFPDKACFVASDSLTDETGKPVAHQLSGRAYWGESEFIKRATLSFVVDQLPALGRRAYTLTFGAAAVEAPVPPHDLEVGETENAWEIRTGAFGLRTLRGAAEYDPPKAIADVPAPVTAFRLRDGTWFGGASFSGPAKVAAWKTELVETGPAFAAVRATYTLEAGGTLVYTFRLVQGDYAALMTAHSDIDLTNVVLSLDLSANVTIEDAVLIPGLGQYAKEVETPLEPGKTGPQFYLNSWPGDGWFKDSPAALRIRLKDRDEELQLSVVDAGSWVEPDPFPEWADFQPWDYEQMPIMWAGWQRKRIPFLCDKAGGLSMAVNAARGDRKWMLGSSRQPDLLIQRFRGEAMSVYSGLPRLNEVKDMVLSWKSSRRQHPCLMVNGQRELGYGAVYDQEAFKKATDVDALREQLNALGRFDPMRSPKPLAYLFDGCYETVAPEERELFKAQLAYVGYLLRDPLFWSFERGACSGNPNMTVSRTVNIGLIGCVLLDHPKGPEWAGYAIDWIKYWLENVTDDQGVWVESSHYARYSLSCMTLMAIAARNAGLHDFLSDPVFKKMALYYEKSPTPPDPMRRVYSFRLSRPDLPAPAVRADPTYGRGTRGDAWPTSGLLARATAKSDPAFSRTMQWAWRACGFVVWYNGKTCGQSSLWMNPYLPAEAPDWSSECFANRGYLLRSHVGTARENYLYFITRYYRSADGEIWPSTTGAIIKWFACGVPIGGSFVRMYTSSHPLFENRVMLANNWDPAVGVGSPSGYVTKTSHGSFAALPRADFTDVLFEVPEIKDHIMKIDTQAPAFPRREREGEVPLVWRRQLMLAKPMTPAGQSYLVVRDTVDCAQPTQWHFWTLTDGIAAAGEPAGTNAAGAGPGATVQPCRELTGSRFTAVGQFGTDCEYYIAAPLDTPRYTLRWGKRQSGYGLRGNYPEYQDLMHLQLPGQGAYFVCLYPRETGRAAPSFETLCDGTAIRIRAPGLIDTCFLSDIARSVSDGDVAFEGTSASVQNRPEGLTLMLGAGGRVTCRGYALESPAAVALQVAPGMIRLRRAGDAAQPLEVTCILPGVAALSAETDGVSVESRKPGWLPGSRKRAFVVRLVAGSAGGTLLTR